MSDVSGTDTSQVTPAAVALSLPVGAPVRLLLPRAAEEAGADPLVRIERAHGVLVSLLGGVYSSADRLVLPLEIAVAADPATVGESAQVPSAAILEAFNALPDAAFQIAIPHAARGFAALFDTSRRSGVWLYCRKRRSAFEARSPRTGRTLGRLSAERASDLSDLARAMALSDAAGDPGNGALTYAADRARDADDWRRLETLLQDQGRVAALRAGGGLAEGFHGCTGCPELQRCFAVDDYAYYADRLVPISAADLPLRVLPFGAWRLDEAAQLVGGRRPLAVAQEGGSVEPGFAAWRRAHAERIESFGPPRLLSGETDGRELLEMLRLKLGLITDALRQLDRAWQLLARPHLCWNADSIRVGWHAPHPLPAACWGFEALLRKIGWHPLTGHTTPAGAPIPYPPAFSAPELLPPEVLDAARYFDEPRRCTLFIKRSRPSGPVAEVRILAEGLGVPRGLFRGADAVVVGAAGQSATLTPAASDDGDGEGLALTGSLPSDSPLAARGTQLDGAEARWRPLFGQAVDLHAFGMLALGALLSHDERPPAKVYEMLAALRVDLTSILEATPLENRERAARAWAGEHAESDAPAAVLSRRNLWSDADGRASGKLEPLPPALWRTVVQTLLRMITNVEGFSYCADRTAAAPRLEGQLLLPLAELEGFLALLDDRLFSRTGAAAAVQTLLQGESAGA